MTMPPRTVVLAAALALAACGPSPADPPEATASPSATVPGPTPETEPEAQGATASESVLALEGEGLRVFDSETGAARPLPFGTPMDRTVAVLTALLGDSVESGVNDECAATFETWDGLTAWFSEDLFVGWATGSGATGDPLTTADGVGVGSTRQDLDDSYDAQVTPSSLGEEFNAGDLNGLLDSAGPDARITDLWAGTTCIFR